MPLIGDTQLAFCEGCEEETIHTLVEVDYYMFTSLYWECEAFSPDGDYVDGEIVDVTDYSHRFEY